jgi:hypothetical protein
VNSAVHFSALFNSDQRISLQLAVFSMISNPNLQLRALPNHKRLALPPASSDTTKQALRLPWTLSWQALRLAYLKTQTSWLVVFYVQF